MEASGTAAPADTRWVQLTADANDKNIGAHVLALCRYNSAVFHYPLCSVHSLKVIGITTAPVSAVVTATRGHRDVILYQQQSNDKYDCAISR